MSDENHGTFIVKSWEEKLTQDFGGGSKFTEALVTQIYEGVITGEGVIQYVLWYRGTASPAFAGFERVNGTVGGKNGSFVIRHSGAFEHGLAKSNWSIVRGSGTGELQGIGGIGTFTAGKGGQGAVIFNPVFA
jgi:hypothetical protein